MHPAPTDPSRPTLGIIAGGGAIPVTVAAAARDSGRPVVVFGIRGEADHAIQAFPHHWVRWGEIGRLFDLLVREKVGDIVIAGSVSRPDFSAIRVDLGAILSLPRILALMVGGDDTVLKGVVRFFEDRGYTIIGAHSVAPDLVATVGQIGRYGPSASQAVDIGKGFEAARVLGSLDIGQAVVGIGGRVVGVEGVEGTDELIGRIADLRRRGRLKWSGREGVLVKAAKPQQDLRVDMPTVGPKTVALVADAGLAGIAVEAGRVMIVDRAATVAAADAARVFLVAETLDMTPADAPIAPEPAP
ncbi:LpxI family protein [Chthonobacter rhizosphaerae]|uniref:LpxI family protein n=1 Tax=Chthonobacter rhizosphaerae TaxID=2735553 RepID=UPI0015EF3B62|nr:UDP-2,3-diacylglucosamine diphosphatase LpxI [Chthonobacter rhizosphaerae]